MNLTVTKSKHAVQQAGDTLVSWLSENVSSPLLFLVSGGSAFAILDMVPKKVLGPHVTIGVLDERFSTDLLVNNFCQLSSLPFFRRATEAGCAFIDTRVYSGDTIEAFADRFEVVLQEWKLQHPEGKVIITQGIGPDGHTAGIMPFPEDPVRFKELFEREQWVVGYDAGSKNTYPLRVTVTNTFLRNGVDSSVILASGEAKKIPLECVMSEDGVLADTPARIVREMQDVIIVTDQPLSF